MPQFSDTVMDHFLNPRNVGVFEAPSGEGCAGTPEGGRPFVQMQVLVDDGRIAGARFRTYGCVPAIASASYVCEWAGGRPPEDTRQLTPSQLIALLGGLPEDRAFCAELAVHALQAALKDAEARAAAVDTMRVTP